MPIATAITAQSAERVIADLKRFGAAMEADRRKVLTYAAVPLVQAMQQRAPVGTGTHKRYQDGKVVARYRPGNLRRSLQVLNKLKRTDRVFVGPRKDGSKGSFGGTRFDPYYASWVNKGTRRMRHRPFFEPAIDAAAPQVRRRIEMGFEITLKKFTKR